MSLIGFSKIGHPGVMYAIGDEADLMEWIREIKSWNWLALRVKMSPEPIPEEKEQEAERRGREEGARGGRGRGEWVEVEKVGDALNWLRERGGEKRARILTDVGVGGGTRPKEGT